MILVCGEALFDVYAEDSMHGLRLDARVGGSPFNVAVGLARLGRRSSLLTGLSRDFLGKRLRDALNAESIDTATLIEIDAPTTLAFVSVGPGGGAEYAFYGQSAADRSVTVDDLPVLGPEVTAVHAGSYSLVTDPTGAALLELFRRERGRRLLSIDPNVRLNVEPDPAVWRSRVAAFSAVANLIKVSAEDIEALFEGTTADDVARRWLAGGAELIVVTHGADGATAYAADAKVHRPGQSTTPGDGADTVGAGDTFQAALLAELDRRGVKEMSALNSNHLAQMLDFAAHAAAITCSRRGADLPRLEEVQGTL